ncbi:MAG TPA: hypothetical protein VM821_02250, partial [Abditibacteriaceae bacterium]|nr:hypothetical protein [Abditibacteriaceae bacterium]
MPYASLTENDRAQMRQTIGIESVGELFADIPDKLRQNAAPGIGDALPEMAARRKMNMLASRNLSLEQMTSFLGAGSYDHYIPAVVPALAGRGEFATAYTPYQAETSQGTLQV